MNRYTVAVLVKNQFGVLNRVTSMFRRRQFNITALSVSETETNELSRITVTFDGDTGKDQLINQLYKLPDVCSIKEFSAEDSISYELLLIKMANKAADRSEIQAAVQGFGAETVDYSKDSIVLRYAGDSRKVDEFIELMRDFTILEICRSGSVSLERGGTTIKQIINY